MSIVGDTALIVMVPPVDVRDPDTGPAPKFAGNEPELPSERPATFPPAAV